MFIIEPNSKEWEEMQEELRKCLVAHLARQRLNYKPNLIERIICLIKFNQLKKGLNDVFQNRDS